MSDPVNNDLVLSALLAARARREPCVLATVIGFKGSTPRKPGAKMLVYADGRSEGTVGGGAMEHRQALHRREPDGEAGGGGIGEVAEGVLGRLGDGAGDRFAFGRAMCADR